MEELLISLNKSFKVVGLTVIGLLGRIGFYDIVIYDSIKVLDFLGVKESGI